MIHHFSMPARDPRRVATVLAELMKGYAGPFVGPIPNAWAAYNGDAHGTGIEVYPDNTRLRFDEARGTIGVPEGEGAEDGGVFHALLSVAVEREDIERIGAREGWRVRHFWRGPPGLKLFEIYEFWVENRVMLELATPDMIGPYVAIANGPAQQALLARRAESAAARGA